MTRKEFISQLQSVYTKAPNQEGMKQYHQKLLDWRISENALKRLYVLLTERHEYFPTIADMAVAAQECGVVTRGRSKEPCWQLFDFNRLRYVRRLMDPFNIPDIPAGADFARLALSDDIQARTIPCSRELARDAFMAGFVGAGGNESVLDPMFRTLRLRDAPEPPEPVFDEDDIPF